MDIKDSFQILLLSLAILTVPMAIIYFGRRLIKELTKLTDIFKGIEARLNGLEHTVARIEKDISSENSKKFNRS